MGNRELSEPVDFEEKIVRLPVDDVYPPRDKVFAIWRCVGCCMFLLFLLFLTFGAAQVVQFLQVAVVLELDLDFSC